jgi:ATPase family protein associated with various cellular activities (AAA)
MVRSYLEWLVELPRSKFDPERIDIDAARQILKEDPYGLDKVKRRILKYLAVRKLNPDSKSPILCFVGPPGVGRTSLGQSIARATGRKFVTWTSWALDFTAIPPPHCWKFSIPSSDVPRQLPFRSLRSFKSPIRRHRQCAR